MSGRFLRLSVMSERFLGLQKTCWHKAKWLPEQCLFWDLKTMRGFNEKQALVQHVLK